MPALDLPTCAAAVMLAALAVYALTGGADFGGGVWDLLARGPRARAQRELVAHAIAPIWEANHVWLIVVVVVCFVAFPHAYAAITTALHVPIAVMLVGIVLRGTSFVFRAYGLEGAAGAERWGGIFAVSSVATPFLLGVTIGAAASGAIHVAPNGDVQTDFVSAWLAPFPFATGLFVLALFALLAAVYLVVAAPDGPLREDFRRRALGAAGAVFLSAGLALVLARTGAPALFRGLTATPAAWALQGAIALTGLGTVAALLRRRPGVARGAAAAHVVLLVAGLGLAQHPYLLPPDLPIASAAAPSSVLRPMLVTLAIGAALLVPVYVWALRATTRPG